MPLSVPVEVDPCVEKSAGRCDDLKTGDRFRVGQGHDTGAHGNTIFIASIEIGPVTWLAVAFRINRGSEKQGSDDVTGAVIGQCHGIRTGCIAEIFIHFHFDCDGDPGRQRKIVSAVLRASAVLDRNVKCCGAEGTGRGSVTEVAG